MHKGRLEILFINRNKLNNNFSWELPDLFVCKEDLGLQLDNEFSYRLIGRLDDRIIGSPSQIISSYIFLQLPSMIDQYNNNNNNNNSFRYKWVSVKYLRDIIFSKPEPKFSKLSIIPLIYLN